MLNFNPSFRPVCSTYSENILFFGRLDSDIQDEDFSRLDLQGVNNSQTIKSSQLNHHKRIEIIIHTRRKDPILKKGPSPKQEIIYIEMIYRLCPFKNHIAILCFSSTFLSSSVSHYSPASHYSLPYVVPTTIALMPFPIPFPIPLSPIPFRKTLKYPPTLIC